MDINCDMGEGMGNEAEVMPFITSANIACGYHAGDEDIMKRTIELAVKHKVHIGAHPSFPDPENFGRTEMHLDEQVLYDIIVLQIKVLDTIAEMSGVNLHHVKPHGALYNMAAKDAAMAHTIARAVKDINKDLILYGLSGSFLISEAKELGLKTANEVFADRTYQDDGSLTSRKEENALITDEAIAVKQVRQMIEKGTVTTVSGKEIPIVADTVCVHGDGANVIKIVREIASSLGRL